jgi:uncharacterized protein
MEKLSEYDFLDRLIDACRRSDLKSVALWCSQGASVNEIELPNDFTPLTSAAYAGNAEICAYLVGRGANVNWMSKEGNSALDSAIRSCKSATCVKVLLDLGADPNATASAGWTHLMNVATSLRLVEKDEEDRMDNVRCAMAEYLVLAGADVNAKERLGQTALMFAAEMGDIKMCEQLLALKADPNIQSDSGRYAVDYADGQSRKQLETLFINCPPK